MKATAPAVTANSTIGARRKSKTRKNRYAAAREANAIHAARRAEVANHPAALAAARKEAARLADDLMQVAKTNGIALTPARAFELAIRLQKQRKNAAKQRASGKPKKRRPKIGKRTGYTGSIARMQKHVTERGWVVQVGNHCRIV